MMAATRIKICGICRAEDATSAIDLGASAIGFVFWPGSPRSIEPARAREIAANLPAHVTAVGVFGSFLIAALNLAEQPTGSATDLHDLLRFRLVLVELFCACNQPGHFPGFFMPAGGD
jgi:phosphoribosylanthranilate isomerase